MPSSLHLVGAAADGELTSGEKSGSLDYGGKEQVRFGRAQMIGRLRFQHYEATLEDDLGWSVPADALLQDALNTAFGPAFARSPADGFPGYDQLISASQHFDVPFEAVDPPFNPDELY